MEKDGEEGMMWGGDGGGGGGGEGGEKIGEEKLVGALSGDSEE